MSAYYNEIDPKAAATLRELIRAGVIAPGEVDERSIADVAPGDLVGFRQCHFFAGGGVWSYALRLAGVPDSEPVWTGSCPCQPFSVAGRQRGSADERHLWPELRRLIRECRPAIVFGEQVASPAGRTWLHDVRADLEGMAYALGGADLCAAGIGAPHIRQRLYWVADADEGRGGRDAGAVPRAEAGAERGLRGVAHGAEPGRAARGMVNVLSSRLEGHRGHGDDGHEPGRLHAHAPGSTAAASAARRVADSDGGLASDRNLQRSGEHGLGAEDTGAGDGDSGAGPTNGYWRAADWLFCRDENWRPVEPGTFPLVDGAPARMGRLRLYGNAIVAQVAATFIEAYCDVSGQ